MPSSIIVFSCRIDKLCYTQPPLLLKIQSQVFWVHRGLDVLPPQISPKFIYGFCFTLPQNHVDIHDCRYPWNDVCLIFESIPI